MSSEACRRFRGALAARALGVADPGLDAHLDGCPHCRAELEELRATAAAVVLADPDRLHGRPAPPPLADRIVARVARESAAARRRRIRRAVAGAAAAVVAAAVAVAAVSSLASSGTGGGARITLAGSEAGATATLVERAWGTEVTLETDGLDEGEVYWLWLTDVDGDRVGAGTVTGTGRPMTAVFASALPTDEARRIWVTDEDDAVVLDARIPAS